MCFVFSGGESGGIRSPCFVVFTVVSNFLNEILPNKERVLLLARFVEEDRQILKGRNER